MKIEQAVRVFKYNGMELQNPGAAQSVEEVREFYANLYPELNNAEIEGPEHKAGKIVYEFRKAVGTKGHDLLAHLTARAAGKAGVNGAMPAGETLDLSAAIAMVAEEPAGADQLSAPSSLLPPLP